MFEVKMYVKQQIPTQIWLQKVPKTSLATWDEISIYNSVHPLPEFMSDWATNGLCHLMQGDPRLQSKWAICALPHSESSNIILDKYHWIYLFCTGLPVRLPKPLLIFRHNWAELGIVQCLIILHPYKVIKARETWPTRKSCPLFVRPVYVDFCKSD